MPNIISIGQNVFLEYFFSAVIFGQGDLGIRIRRPRAQDAELENKVNSFRKSLTANMFIQVSHPCKRHYRIRTMCLQWVCVVSFAPITCRSEACKRSTHVFSISTISLLVLFHSLRYHWINQSINLGSSENTNQDPQDWVFLTSARSGQVLWFGLRRPPKALVFLMTLATFQKKTLKSH